MDATILLYSDDGQPIGQQLSAVVSGEIALGEHGIEQATVVIPKYDRATGALNGEAHRTMLAPNGRGALIEIDARPIIKPVFLGRIKQAPDSSTATDIQLNIQGPHSWLGKITVPAEATIQADPGRVIRNYVTAHGGRLRLLPGTFDEGMPIEATIGGGSFLDLVTNMEGMSTGRLHLTALPRSGKCVADWRDVMARRGSDVPVATLTSAPGGNVISWSTDNDLDPDLDTLVLVGRSFTAGTSVQAVAKAAPSGPVVGRLAALSAQYLSAVVAAFTGGGAQQLRPDLVTKSALEAAATTYLQQHHASTVMVTFAVRLPNEDDPDPDLRRVLDIGSLVLVELPDEALGLWRRSVGEVRAMTFGLSPEESFAVTCELWSLED